MKRMMRAALLAAGGLMAVSAQAADVYWSVGVHGPGVVTTVGNHPPQPRVIVAQPYPPAIYAPAPVHYMPPPRVVYAPPVMVVYPGWGRGGDSRWDDDRHDHRGRDRFDAHRRGFDHGDYRGGGRRDEHGDRWRR
jgi:hypothetical protein